MKSKRRAFTLIELIAVIGIILVLVTIMAIALRRPRGTVHQAVCVNNLRDIAAAANNYANVNKAYPAGYVDASTRWMDLIEDQIDKDSEVYLCPADRQQLTVTDDPSMRLSYGINRFTFTTADYSFYNGVKLYRVERPAETIIFADCTPGKFTCGNAGATFDPNNVQDVAYRHMDGGFCAAFCDGHAEPLGTTSQEQWDASPSP